MPDDLREIDGLTAQTAVQGARYREAAQKRLNR